MTQCSAPMLSLTISASNNRVSGYTYDSSGNVLNDTANTYTWTAEGRMATAVVSGTTTTYTYDGYGRRVEKSGSKLYWYGPNGEVLAESDLSGNILSEYIYFNGQRIARFEPANGNTVYYYLSDRLGSAKQIVSIGLNGTLNGCNSTTPTGCIVAESDYYPYGGERVITTDSTSNAYKYTSHERDTETGLDHTDNRQYSSNTGRWLAADPGKGSADFPQSWNRYAYVLANSTNDIDPTGGTCIVADTDGNCLEEDTGDDGGDSGGGPQGGGCQLGGNGWVGASCAAWAAAGTLSASTKVGPPQTCQQEYGTPSTTADPQLAVVMGENSYNFAPGADNSAVGPEDTDMEQAMYNYATNPNGPAPQPGTSAGVDATINTGTYRGYPTGAGTGLRSIYGALTSYFGSPSCVDLLQAENAYNAFWAGSQNLSNVNQWRAASPQALGHPGAFPQGGNVFWYNPLAFYSPNRPSPPTPPVTLP